MVTTILLLALYQVAVGVLTCRAPLLSVWDISKICAEAAEVIPSGGECNGKFY